MSGFGGPSGSTGTGGGGTANVFAPPNQAGNAQTYQNLLTSLANPAAANQAQAPLTGPYMGQALTGATQGAYYGNQLGTGLVNEVQTLLPQIENNPYLQRALAGARQGAQYGSAGAGLAAGAAPGLYQGAKSVLNTGFDPQQALYNRTQQQLLDQQNAINSMSGIASTPYGAGVTGQTMSNFNIDWQNQQLARQLSALQGAGGAEQQGLGLSQGATGLAAAAGGLPAGVYQQNLGNILGGLGSASNIGGQGINTLTGSAALPFNTATSIDQASQQPLQQVLNDIQSFLGLGQNASQISGQLGQMGVNQLGQGLFGAGLAANQASPFLFGSQGLTGALGLSPTTGLAGGLSGLFGGGAAAGGGIDALSGLPVADFIAAL